MFFSINQLQQLFILSITPESKLKVLAHLSTCVGEGGVNKSSLAYF